MFMHSSITSQNPKNSSPSPFRGTTDQQLKLIDLCTQHEGLYFDCDGPDEFWDTIAIKVAGYVKPTTGLQARSWVDAICQERKECLLQGQIPARRGESEKLDIAIDAWLQIVGRKILQTTLSSIRTGYILTFGPEESDEEHILAKHCRDRLKSNMEYINIQKTKKVKSNRVTSVRLVQAIESIESQMAGQRPTIQALTPDQLYGPVTSCPRESLFPLLQPENTMSQTLPLTSSHSDYDTVSPRLNAEKLLARGLRTCPPTTAIPRDVAEPKISYSQFSQKISTPRTLFSGEKGVRASGLQSGKNLDWSLDLALPEWPGNATSFLEKGRISRRQSDRVNPEASSSLLAANIILPHSPSLRSLDKGTSKDHTGTEDRGLATLEDGESLQVQSNKSSDKGTLPELLVTPAIQLSRLSTKTGRHPQRRLNQQFQGQARDSETAATATYSPDSFPTGSLEGRSQPSQLAIPFAVSTVHTLEEQAPFSDDVSVIYLTQSPTRDPIKREGIDLGALRCDVSSSAANMNGVISIMPSQLMELVSATVSEIISRTTDDFEVRASHRFDNVEFHLRRLYEITRRRKQRYM
ncbi:hypothetical protein F5X99DRAFT_413697 [Biscogniauxia marginata]|nr:hypothetical protein F5X99DRAFT_413697 [Biscogniauxia marginata]